MNVTTGLRSRTLSPMIMAGVELMFVGMSTVFAFLGLLVVLMHASARIVAHLSPPPLVTKLADVDDDAQIAVVLAAVAAARQRVTRRSA